MKFEQPPQNKIENQEPEEIKNVQEIFDLNPELENIGTKEQYLKYMETIFPESKVPDLVYHGTLSSENILSAGFSKDFLGSSSRSTTSKDGFFFGNNKENSENYLFKDEIEWLAKVIYSFEKFKQEKGGEKELIEKKAQSESDVAKQIRAGWRQINLIDNLDIQPLKDFPNILKSFAENLKNLDVI
jgi:hypothetical protein